MKVISVNNVSAYYDDYCALKDVNLDIKEKDFAGIIGPNGGGKSTLLKIILGLKRPDKGFVKLYNKPTLGYVPQFTTFSKDFPVSVMSVVLMGLLKNKKFPYMKFSDEDKDKAYDILEKVDILKFKNRNINSLSGGQLQKVMLARALISNPDILILDEPASNIDAKSETEILNMLKEMNKNMTILMVSHSTGMISSYFKTLICVNVNVYHHQKSEIDKETLDKVYGCPMELVGHGEIPHRILKDHKEKKDA